MKYSDYYKILHRRNRYNVKFLADFLTLYFPFSAIDYDTRTRIFSIPRCLVGALTEQNINILSRVIASHSYYDSFDNDKLLLIPLYP